jgi:AAA+ ATPase superfamily predicted ATPase
MATTFIGRKKEQEVLQKALQSNEAEMVSVIGRRRIGKTFLIKNAYKDHTVFEVTGVKDRPEAEQLRNFTRALNRIGQNLKAMPTPKNWQEAFFALADRLEALAFSEKRFFF